ncbi:zinc ribbon domain-containing protein [Dactylosporangium sp. NPDC005572]|uniref:zinc ribbon domain-containing protein n=1 Tax=Dactylosporangium sp. NPDC005572 TaxID=3156889 RepID=UPI0033BA788A
MSSIPAEAARVRDPGLPLRRRLLALRECVLHFAPYGFRATWHHLVVAAGIPVRLADDPAALVRAVDELEEARQLWRTEAMAFASRRLREKAAGRRQPRRDDAWRSCWALAFCPDPETHPRERLAAVVRRLIMVYRSGGGPADVCPACGTRRAALPCPACGACPLGARPLAAPAHGLPWELIWHRAVRRETTVGGGDIDQFRVEFTPASTDGRFGVFQLYVRGTALGDATTTALLPHLGTVRALCDTAESAGSRGPEPLVLGDTFDHLDVTLETDERDMIFEFATRSAWGEPPAWAPWPGRRLRRVARRSEVIRAWREAEPLLRRFGQVS